jgi:hypothetical protein
MLPIMANKANVYTVPVYGDDSLHNDDQLQPHNVQVNNATHQNIHKTHIAHASSVNARSAMQNIDEQLEDDDTQDISKDFDDSTAQENHMPEVVQTETQSDTDKMRMMRIGFSGTVVVGTIMYFAFKYLKSHMQKLTLQYSKLQNEVTELRAIPVLVPASKNITADELYKQQAKKFIQTSTLKIASEDIQSIRDYTNTFNAVTEVSEQDVKALLPACNTKYLEATRKLLLATETCKKHAIICGPAGTGKSNLSELLIRPYCVNNDTNTVTYPLANRVLEIKFDDVYAILTELLQLAENDKVVLPSSLGQLFKTLLDAVKKKLSHTLQINQKKCMLFVVIDEINQKTDIIDLLVEQAKNLDINTIWVGNVVDTSNANQIANQIATTKSISSTVLEKVQNQLSALDHAVSDRINICILKDCDKLNNNVLTCLRTAFKFATKTTSSRKPETPSQDVLQSALHYFNLVKAQKDFKQSDENLLTSCQIFLNDNGMVCDTFSLAPNTNHNIPSEALPVIVKVLRNLLNFILFSKFKTTNQSTIDYSKSEYAVAAAHELAVLMQSSFVTLVADKPIHTGTASLRALSEYINQKQSITVKPPIILPVVLFIVLRYVISRYSTQTQTFLNKSRCSLDDTTAALTEFIYAIVYAQDKNTSMERIKDFFSRSNISRNEGSGSKTGSRTLHNDAVNCSATATALKKKSEVSKGSENNTSLSDAHSNTLSANVTNTSIHDQNMSTNDSNANKKTNNAIKRTTGTALPSKIVTNNKHKVNTATTRRSNICNVASNLMKKPNNQL